MRPKFLVLPLFFLPFVCFAQTQLSQNDGKWQLTHGGKSYTVKGAGGETRLDTLAAAGGNSIRLWGDDHLGERLDQAQKLGLTVTAGIWLGQIRQGFDWSDADSLIRQSDHVAEVVKKHKDHPALLMWALGNEMEDPEGKNGAVWSAINNLARTVKQIDPNHPTMTVIAEIGGDKVRNIHKLCPDIDIIGINTYAGGPTVPARYKENGGTKPYILTEFGPPGIWECPRNAIGAFEELTSTEKADRYRESYTAAVINDPSKCLGSYAFFWGVKQEVTATWFSMFLHDGSRLAPIDTMTELWSGKPPANKCPQIDALTITGNPKAKPGTTLTASLKSSDPESDPLKVEWALMRDPEEYGTGGDAEDSHLLYPDALVKTDNTSAEIVLPEDGGLYRLFATVHDGKGGAAVANVPLRVDAPMKLAKGADTRLPLILYAETDTEPNYIPAGWMGNADAIKVTPDWAENPKSGKTSLKCDFTASEGWGGVVWQNPEGDWGDRGGGYNLGAAKTLSFWARGEKGGEAIDFSFGILEAPKKFVDTANGSLKGVTLTTDWKKYQIPVEGKNLDRIKTGFVWTLASPGTPVTFYLDDIQWE